MVVADPEEAAETQDSVRDLTGHLINHDALDRSDLRVVRAINCGPSTLSLPIREPVSLASATIGSPPVEKRATGGKTNRSRRLPIWGEGKRGAAGQDERTFVKESDDGFDELRDRPVSEHPNDVTKEGLARTRRWPGKGLGTSFRRQALPLKRKTGEDNAPTKLIVVAMLLTPLPVFAQGGGSGGSGGGSAGGASAGGAASGSTAGSGSAVGSPNAGSAGAGTAGVSGVPSGPANAGGLNNSGNDPSGAGNSAKMPEAPGTNAAGTANSSGSTDGTGARGSITTGTAGNRAGGTSTGRIDGTTTPGPSMPGDAEIRAEDPKVNQQINSICKGC